MTIKEADLTEAIVKQLFQYVEREVSSEVDMLMVSTATKNSWAILHFYTDEVGMEFWTARLFKKI